MPTNAISALEKFDQTSRTRVFIGYKHRRTAIRASHIFARVGVNTGLGGSIALFRKSTIYCDI